MSAIKDRPIFAVPSAGRRTRAFIVVVAIVLGLGATAYGSDPHFLNPYSLAAVPPQTTSAKIGDFTGDGRNDVLVIVTSEPDWILGAWTPGGVTLRIGSEHDGFAQAIDTPIDRNFTVSGTADFTGDGILDLYLETAGEYHSLVGVMPGTSTGAFAALIRTTLAGFYATSVPADFDGDGKMDLVTIGQYGRPIQFLRGLGDGRFEPPISSPLESANPEGAMAGDFDGDGRIDIALVAEQASNNSDLVLWNEGNGAFTTSHHGTLNTGNVLSGVGDVDGDGRADLVFRNKVSFSAAGRLFVPEPFPSSSNGGSREIVDLDGNGTADIVTNLAIEGLNNDQLGCIEIISSTPTGGFSRRLYLPGPDVGFTTLGDLDADGDTDLLFSRGAYDSEELLWIAGNGDGTLRSNPAVDLCPNNPCPSNFKVVVMDVNGDRAPDFVTYDGSALIVTPSIGHGLWGTSIRTETDHPRINRIVAGDFDGDEHDDLVLIRLGDAGASSTWTILLGRADGTFHASQTFADVPAEFGKKIAIGDLSGDGISDLIDPSGSIRPGSGRGTFGSPIATNMDQLWWAIDGTPKFDLIDLNGDGTLDIAAREGKSYLNNGVLSFTARYMPNSSEEKWRASIFADMTGDGIPDLLDMEAGDYRQTNTAWLYDLPTTQRISVRRGLGDGTFEGSDQPEGNARLPWFRGGIKSTDFDGDGNVDVVLGTDILFGDPVKQIRSIASLDFDSWTSYDPWRVVPEYRVEWIGSAHGEGSQSIVIGSRTSGIYAHLPIVADGEPTIDTTIHMRRDQPYYRGTVSPNLLVVQVASKTGVPRGTVRFESRGNVLGFAALDRFGTAAVPPSFESSDLVAVYLGNEQFRESRTYRRRSSVRH